MLAILLAGGEGERLRPITCTLPKPMAEVLGRPILAHTLALLKAHGIEQAAMTLGYLSESIMDEFSDGSEYGISLRYYTEKTPLGTAGSVLNAKDFLSETFAVISGDALTDINLSEALAFHRQRGALATLILKEVRNPTSYGLVNIDASGRVLSFHEKPAWHEVNTDTANTGIYILEPDVLSYIPEGGPYDFGKQLFPALLEKSLPVYGYVTKDYWCDIGDVKAYLSANLDALNGRLKTCFVSQSGIVRMPGAIVDHSARIEPPVFIGAHARIERGAFVGAGSVIGDYARICENASVKRSVVYPGSVIGAGVQLRAAVVCKGAKLHEGAAAYEESVIGSDCIVEARASIRPGVRIWPGKRVFEGAEISDNMIWGQRAKRFFEGPQLHCDAPEDCVRIGRTIAWKTGCQTALVGRCTGAVSAAQERALLSGLIAGGVKVYLAGECTLPLLRHAQRLTAPDLAFLVSGAGIYPLDHMQLPLSPAVRKSVEASLSRQDPPPPYTGYTERAENAGRFDLSYLRELESAYASPLRKHRLALYTPSEQLSYYADRVFRRLKLPARIEWEEELMALDEDETGLYLSEDGCSVRFSDCSGIFNAAETELLICRALAAGGERVLFAPPGATRRLPAEFSADNVEIRYHASEYEFLKCMLRDSPAQFRIRTDALYAANYVLSYLAESGRTLAQFRSLLPDVFCVSREIPLEDDIRAQTLKNLRNALPEEFRTDEWFFERNQASAWLSPAEARPVLTLTSEADTMEAAEDMMNTLNDLIAKSAKKARS